MPEHDQAPRAVTQWLGVRALAVDLDVGPPLTKDLLSAGLELADPPTATLVVASFPCSAAGPAYREVALIHRVVAGGRQGRCCSWSVVDDFAAVLLGPELFGFPRRMGRVAIEIAEESLTASVWLSGRQALALRADLGPAMPVGETVYGGRAVAASDPVLGEARLYERRPLLESIASARSALVSISIDPGCDDAGPLAALATTDGLEGRLATLDLSLPSSAGDHVRDAQDTWTEHGDVEVAPQIAFTGMGAMSVPYPRFTTLG